MKQCTLTWSDEDTDTDTGERQSVWVAGGAARLHGAAFLLRLLPPAGRRVDRKRKEENVRLLLQKGTAECAVQPSQKVTPQKERN